MKNLWRKPTIYGAIALGAMTFACQPQEESPISQNDVVEYVKYKNGDIIPGKYIVRLNPTNINFRKTKNYAANTEAMRKVSSDLLAKYRISAENIEHVYGSSIEGFSVSMTEDQYEELSKDPSVKYIENDRFFVLAPPPGKGPGGGGGSSPAQVTPWGIERVGGGTYNGNGIAYIIDSGIDSGHEDLNVDVSLGFNAFDKGKDGNLSQDGNGHGTHVAGTIAAVDNEIGVIGVAPGATVVPVKVLNSQGSGSYSGVIAGVDFVTGNASDGDVANMSLGGGFSQAVNDAVIALGSAGIKVALAAGNESTFAGNRSPASANGTNIYTVAAFAEGDNWASFSNYGIPPVDFAAPGVAILSTVPGGYSSYNGTSMASPHVAGLLLLGTIHSDGTVNNAPFGDSYPIAHN
ncbi:S8 family peptidase [Algoriphagus zhangzhouensis]|uniref:Peptidase inhibitor I9 n=1 Tax=Algoriphagus zhangzhouensis TaxID=1073327 RepID=A0A1M7ZJX9_9BACT|nr:S8 family peptidase [Algoriphagus zhangzhouensis]TDY43487.1 peptidase inhibitor I9 [Algoriphagus zhangzhouensis]SHO65119.1 Peptidase inhibitor I9 [Algoriphagus zhangzhouensis]